ncbi:hypothetical protein [Streptomyces sp. NPDC101455]
MAPQYGPLGREVTTLPFHLYLDDSDIAGVSDALRHALAQVQR